MTTLWIDSDQPGLTFQSVCRVIRYNLIKNKSKQIIKHNFQ